MKNEGTAMAKSPATKETKFPIFIDAEKMLEKMGDLTRNTSEKAFEFFMKRGGSLGAHFDDWLHAEMELLRPVSVEITESRDAVNIKAAVPGFKPEEIELSVKNAELFMAGEQKTESRNEDESTFYSEWRSNKFARQLRLPCEVDPDGVVANLKDGVLTLTLKKKPLAEPAKITVKAA
jgi:HSP20 family protein